MLWKAIAQAKLPVRIRICMIVASPEVPKERIATKNGPAGSWAAAIRPFFGNAETNAKQVIVYSTPSPITLMSVARGTFLTGFFDSSA
jgi:hypothetical protein